MPLRGIVSALIAPLVMLEHLLASERADGRDLRIPDAELVRIVEYRVHMECRIRRLAAQET